MSEVEADQKSDDGPFSGMKLEDPVPVASSTAIANSTPPAEKPSAEQNGTNIEANSSVNREPEPKPLPRVEKTPEAEPSSHASEESKEPAPVAAARPPAVRTAQQPPQAFESDTADLPTVSPRENRAEAPAKLPEIRSRDPHQEKQARISQRVGLTGFKGFCPVVLREQRELSDSDPRFVSSFEGQTYYFSSEEAKAKFDSAPQLYAPVAGGNDVVQLSNSGEALAGKLDFAVWYQDRLYLFHSRETLEQFVLQPSKHKLVDAESLAP
jgi:YHS domain-containing protein